MEYIIRVLVLAAAICFANVSAAQSSSSISASKPQRDLATHPAWPKANPADVDTAIATVKAFYSALSTPAGSKINRVRLRSLFVPDGRIAIGMEEEPGRPADVVLETLEQLADSADSYTAKSGFFDRTLANHVQHFGVMAQVYSTYESRNDPKDVRPMARGIKSFELLKSGNRWYILQVYWDSERDGNPIPDLYLHDSAETK
jgi:hypothetical protein